MLLSGKQYRLIDPSRYGLISNQLFFLSPNKGHVFPLQTSSTGMEVIRS